MNNDTSTVEDKISGGHTHGHDEHKNHEHSEHHHEHGEHHESCAHCSHSHSHDHGDGHSHSHNHGDGHSHDHGEEITLKKIILASIFFVLGIAVEKIPVAAGFFAGFGNKTLAEGVPIVLFLISYLICGKNVIKSSLSNIRHGEIFDEQFLMSVASIGAIFVGEVAEAVAVMLFYNIGEFFQDYAVDRSRKSIKALMDIRPDKAFVVRNGIIEEISPEDVKIGEIIEVKPGERVPLDGKIVSGETFFDTSALTGESVPRSAHEGDDALSGFINENGVIRIRVEKEYGDSAVTRILELTQQASEVKAKREKFISRFAKVYTPVVCFLALAVAFIPPLCIILFGEAGISSEIWKTWIYRSLMFLVVSCPCALVISVPLSFFSGIGAASQKGILIKGSNFIEALSHAKIAVFDKTGTITKGTFAVSKVCSVGNRLSDEELVEIAAHAEYYSNHPISKSIKFAHSNGEKKECCERVKKENPEEISGLGIKIVLDGKKVLAGNDKLMEQEKVSGFAEKGSEFSHSQAGTVVHIAVDGIYEGCIVIQDEIKNSSADALRELKSAEIKKTVMLTGDNSKTAEFVAKDVGIDCVFGGLLPEGKVEKVQSLLDELENTRNSKKTRGTLLFVGDGINDSPVLARSDIGIAMGAMGSDAAIEAADVVIMDDNLQKISSGIRISRKTMRIINENIVFSLGVKVAIMALGAFGITNMWAAVFGDVGVTFLAILNSLRLLMSRK